MKTWKFVPLREIPQGGIKPHKRNKNPYVEKEIVDIFKYSQFKIGGVKKRSEFNDYDYIHKLNDKEREWLYNFHREWLCADMNHKGQKFHTSKKDRKKCWDKNNQNGRDIYAIKRVTKQLQFLGDDVFKLIDSKNYFEKE